MRRERGITLIALVITIIVLIILAGVSIQLLLGENGIITKAKKGKGDYQEASVIEKVEMALVDYNSDKITNGEEGEIEEALNKLLNDDIFDDIEIEESIGIVDNYEITLSKEKGEVIIESVNKATGSIRLRCEVSTKEYTKESITIKVKATGNIVKLIKPDNKEVTPTNGKIELDYSVSENGTYLFKVEGTDGTPVEKPVIIDNIDTLEPQAFDITAKQVDKKIVITASTEDTEATTTSACSGIDRYEYFVKKVADANYPEKPYTTNEVPVSEYGSYKILVKAYDKAGNPKDCNEEIIIEMINQNPLKYGQKVNYSANGVEDWKIFYINEERNETFIIISGYLPIEKIPTNATGLIVKENYNVDWKPLPSYVEITQQVRDRFMFNWKMDEINRNIECVSRLLDTSAWSILVADKLKDKGVTAIGTPTLEMLCASWNEVYPKQKLTNPVKSTNGYARELTNETHFKGSEGSKNLLYIPYYNGIGNTDGYLLATPSAQSNTWLNNNKVNVLRGIRSNSSYTAHEEIISGNGAIRAIRPVVCIPSNLLEYNTTTSSWDINVE